MLEDTARVQAYKQAILGNMEYFKDKVVMDVGCGTGILSIFCAQAGAKKVYTVEASNLASLARELVKENNFQNVIEVRIYYGTKLFFTSPDPAPNQWYNKYIEAHWKRKARKLLMGFISGVSRY